MTRIIHKCKINERYHLLFLIRIVFLNRIIKAEIMKTIVHATDLSENAISALKYAYALSTKMKANLWVIHVFNQATISSDLSTPYFLPEQENMEYKKIKLKEYCVKILGNDFSKLKINIEVIDNSSIVKSIISKANKLKATLILVGMKGHNLLNEFIMGSVSKQLIEDAPYPVIAVPANTILKDLKTIVYATDFEASDITAISKLIEIVAPFKSTIHIAHISTKKEYEGYQQMEWFKEIIYQKISYKKIEFYIFFEEDIYNSLYSYSKEVQADLIVMLERKKKGLFNNIFHEDLVKKMKTHTVIPLMSFNQ